MYTSCGFQSKLKVHRSLARAVTLDNEVATNSRTLHTLNVGGQFMATEKLLKDIEPKFGYPFIDCVINEY